MPKLLSAAILGVGLLIGVSEHSYAEVIPSNRSSPKLTVRFQNGRRAPAYIDPRTDGSRIWLRFGSERIRLVRAFDWSEVSVESESGLTLSVDEVMRIAETSAESESKTETKPGVRSLGDRPTMSPALPTAIESFGVPAPGGTGPISSIQFDVELANWDGDIEADGLLLQIRPMDSRGLLTTARGQANIELWGIKRIEQDSQPRTRGRAIERVARTSVPIPSDHFDDGYSLRLPFGPVYPEFDSNWSALGIVYVELVLPGSGVFRQTIDGVRIRPFTPVRDIWRLHGSGGFPPIQPTVHR